MHHYHYGIFAYFAFFAGWAVHMWGKASVTVQSKLNGISSYRLYIWYNGPAVAGRLLLAMFGLGMLSYYDYIMPFIGGFWTTAANFFAAHPGPLPLIWPITGPLGWCADSGVAMVFALLAHKWPWLQQEVPPTFDSAVVKEIASPTPSTAVTKALDNVPVKE
jgi:hypothetical protein